MEKTYLVNYPCPACKKQGMLNYFPRGYQGIDYAHIYCMNCKCWFKKGDEKWEDMMNNLIERPS